MLTSIKKAASQITLTIATAVLCFTSSSHAQEFSYHESHNPYSEVDFGTLSLDDSHDLVRLKLDGDEIEVEIFMFDSQVFDSVPGTLDFDLLEDIASEYEEFDIDADDLGYLVIFLRGGDDIIYSDQDIELPLFIQGGEGNDIIQGASGNDFLVGGPGSDMIYGFGGSDSLFGGGSIVHEREDYSVDYLWGGAQADSFFQPRLKAFSFHTLTGSRNPGVNPIATRNWVYAALDKLTDFQSWEDFVIYN